MYSNIFWALFIISKYYAAGSMLGSVITTKNEVYTENRQNIQQSANDAQISIRGITCNNEKYRSIDGTCNSEKNPGLGAAGTPYTRYFDDSYCDGKEEVPCSSSNDCLTSARVISLKVFDDKKKRDPKITSVAVAFGQFITHDLVLGVIGSMVTCCDNGQYTSNQKTHPKCDAIDVPKYDYKYVGYDCLNFVRTDTNDCKPVNPISGVTHYMDASTVYGSDDETARSLRTGSGGKLQSVERHGKKWLPQNMATAACSNVTSPEEPCYRAGDARVNQNPPLALMHIMFMRFHNYIAGQMCDDEMCPWDDEKCYQETRRIVTAMVQKIAYEDYLPIILGRKHMYKHKLIYNESCRDEYGYVNDYSCDCDPTISVEFASAAFRGQHSAIPGHYKLYFDKENKEDCENEKTFKDYFDETGSIELSDWMNRPSVIEKGDNSEGLYRGFFAQHQEAVDPNYVDQVRHKLFRNEDLVSRDIQRSRDHGVATYRNVALQYGVLNKCDCFDDLRKHISDKHVEMLEKIYDGDINSVELMVAGLLEHHVRDTLTGPCFHAIMMEQFRNVRCGDRYFYEGSEQPYPFTPEQLENIREVTMSSIICQFGDGIDRIQKNAFKKISKKNPLVNCCDLPTLDYSLYKYKDNK